jgi:hypothetical protein
MVGELFCPDGVIAAGALERQVRLGLGLQPDGAGSTLHPPACIT